ncbi:MAG: transposase zinc-binding domain-containing protein, partial [Planctomycetales bacterium]|nr:transposase zinc-binding domain-containing protein [Planctomycetales bacterium]
MLRRYTADFVKHHRPQAAPQVQSTLAKLELCRTVALGGHLYRCDPCDFECRVNNSCGDRHCPQCAGAKRADWLDSTSQLLLPG